MQKARHTTKSKQSAAAQASVVKLVRAIPPLTRLVLLVRAGGHCEFDGCDRYLLEHHVTLTEGNFSELAHIVAFQPGGPRGRSGKRPPDINDANNLMVLCPDCHKLIDDNPKRFTRRTLQAYKKRHEDHIRHVTGLSPERKTSVLVFTACVGEQNAYVPFDQVLEAVSPRYPISRPGKIIDLNAVRMDKPASVRTGCDTVRREVGRLYDIGGDTHTAKHLCVFALAPIPLLIFLGAQLSNKIPTELYQRHRDTETWTWKHSGKPAKYRFRRLQAGADAGKVAVIMSLSGTIRPRDLPKDLDRQYTIYEFALAGGTPSPTFLRTKADLEEFRLAYQDALATVVRNHRGIEKLHFFPAVPAPVAVLCGRELLPKVHPELLVYDFNKRKGGFTYQLTVNQHEH